MFMNEVPNAAGQKHAGLLWRAQYAIADKTATAGTLVEVFETVRAALSDLMDTANFFIAEFDEATGMLYAQRQLGRDERVFPARWPCERSLGGRVIEKKEPVLLLKSEILELIQDNAVELVGPLPEVWMGVPLLNSERVFGVMVVQSYDDPMAYDQESAEILRTVANQLSVYMEKKRAEENLREGEAIFRTFFEQNSVGFSIANAWGEWQLFNDKVCEITGYSREVFETLNWKDITPTEDFERENALLEDLITGKTDTCSLEKRCVRADGSLTDVTVSARAIGERSGGMGYYAFIIQDISERKRAERELQRHQEALIGSMAILAEHRDHGTGEHIRRTKEYVRKLLERSGGERLFPPEHVSLLWQAAILHDIGKVGVPDSILLKPGRLTPEEFEIIKQHTVIGSDVLMAAAKILGEAPFIAYAQQIIEFHHEKWDGSGYPHGLKGEEIPFIARVMAVADVYDALVTERPYKKPVSHEEAVAVISEGAGKHFDPCLVDAFLACADDFKCISRAGDPEFPACATRSSD